MTENVAIKSACLKACTSCPWRIANQGNKPDPHKFYTAANLKRLWKGLRDGERMSCHPTDPRMQEFAGYEALADRETTHECTGGLILQQREWMKFQTLAEANPESKTSLKDYTRAHPNGLTRYGLAALLDRAVFGGTVLDGVAMSRPDLSDSEVGYAAITAPRKSK